MKTLLIHPESVNDRHISEAAHIISGGGIIIYPTDTLYAFGCDALSNRAIERLCRLKRLNPDKNLLSIVCADISMAAEYTRIDNRAFRLLKQYLPGPYTFILPSSTTLPKVFKGRRSVGIRVPDNPVALALARELGHPLMTTSIPVEEFREPDDYSGISAGEIEQRYEHGGDFDLLIDGGDGSVTPSTIIDLTDSSSPGLVRNGAGEFTF